MKSIINFSACLKYVFHLGILKYIFHSGDCIVSICNEINFSAGNISWYWEQFKPFKVRYNRMARRFDIVSESGKTSVFLSAIK